MILRIWAVLRSFYLVGIVGYAIWATPMMPFSVARTFDEQYARCANALAPLQRAMWMAIAWIALETLVGWLAVWSRGRTERAAQAKAAEREAKTVPPTLDPSKLP